MAKINHSILGLTLHKASACPRVWLIPTRPCLGLAAECERAFSPSGVLSYSYDTQLIDLSSKMDSR
jgi:hypothetical protein